MIGRPKTQSEANMHLNLSHNFPSPYAAWRVTVINYLTRQPFGCMSIQMSFPSSILPSLPLTTPFPPQHPLPHPFPHNTIYGQEYSVILRARGPTSYPSDRQLNNLVTCISRKNPRFKYERDLIPNLHLFLRKQFTSEFHINEKLKSGMFPSTKFSTYLSPFWFFVALLNWVTDWVTIFTSTLLQHESLHDSFSPESQISKKIFLMH